MPSSRASGCSAATSCPRGCCARPTKPRAAYCTSSGRSRSSPQRLGQPGQLVAQTRPPRPTRSLRRTPQAPHRARRPSCKENRLRRVRPFQLVAASRRPPRMQLTIMVPTSAPKFQLTRSGTHRHDGLRHRRGQTAVTGANCDHSHTDKTRLGPGWGRVPSLPRGLRCPHGQLISLTAARRLRAAGPYSPRYSIPPRDVTVTRHHQGFTGVHPSQPLPHL